MVVFTDRSESYLFFFFQAEDGIRYFHVTGVQRVLFRSLDVPPQLVGKKRLLSWSSYWDIRSRAVPVWLDEEIFLDRVEVGPLDDANWRQFSLLLPDGLPRALEGTFVAFRWRVEARRRR